MHLSSCGHFLVLPPGYWFTAVPPGRDQRVWISLAHMNLRTHLTAVEKSLPPPGSASPLSILHPTRPCSTNQIVPPTPPTEAGVGRAAFLHRSNALTSFSGVSTMAKVDPLALQDSTLLFQGNSDMDKK